MDSNQPDPGPGVMHTTTSKASDIASSLLNTTFNPTVTANDSPLTGRKARENTHPCTWPGCTRFFAGPWNVAQHIREKHTFERPYKCQECADEGVDTAFTRQYGLNRHIVQVHQGGSKSRAAQITGGGEIATNAVKTWAPASLEVEDEYSEMMRMLTHEDAEMSDSQFQFDVQQDDTVSGQQHNAAYTCGDCDFAANSRLEVLNHIHAVHLIPNSRFCSCGICTTIYNASKEDATYHEQVLRSGGVLSAPLQEYDFIQDASATQFEPQGGIPEGTTNPTLLLSRAGDGASCQSSAFFVNPWM